LLGVAVAVGGFPEKNRKIFILIKINIYNVGLLAFD
jgi:hypothetical protein